MNAATTSAVASSSPAYKTYEQISEIIRVRQGEIVSTADRNSILGADKLQACLCIYLEDPVNGVRTMANCDPSGSMDNDLVPRIMGSFRRKGGNMESAKCRIFTREFDILEQLSKTHTAKVVDAMKNEFKKYQPEVLAQNFKHIHTSSITDPVTKKVQSLNWSVNEVVMSVPKTDESFGLSHKVLMVDEHRGLEDRSIEWQKWHEGMYKMLEEDFRFPSPDQIKIGPKVRLSPERQNKYVEELAYLCYVLQNTKNLDRALDVKAGYLTLKKCIDREDVAGLNEQRHLATHIAKAPISPLPLPYQVPSQPQATPQRQAAEGSTTWRDVRNAKGPKSPSEASTQRE